MPFSVAMLIGSLRALGWLLWGVCGLIVVLIAARTLRGEPVQMIQLLAIAAACALAAFGCSRFAAMIRRRMG
jgi:multisubunit Na+/H+ antiporter MnhB subunit